LEISKGDLKKYKAEQAGFRKYIHNLKATD
jgi:hypothetical protein